jgi:type I restriction enzyme, S subunit
LGNLKPGRCAVWKSEESIYFQKALHRVRPYGGISSDYISYCLWGDALSGALKKYFTGTGIQHFVGAQLKNYIVPLPPLDEQKRIVTKVRECLEQVEAISNVLNENLLQANQLKQSILNKAFEGEL